MPVSPSSRPQHPGQPPTLSNLAETRLKTSPYKVLGRVTCHFEQGCLTLRGRVPSYYHKQLAQAAVADLAHARDEVQQVVNEIEVGRAG